MSIASSTPFNEARRPNRSARELKEITVGPSAKADVCGTTGRAIQLAIDALAFRGGGTVRLRAGEYFLIDSVRMRENVSLIGEGESTLLRRSGPLVYSDLAVDGDVGQLQVTPAHPERFAPGMGLALKDRRSGWLNASTPFLLLAIDDEGNLQMDQYITSDRLAEEGGRVYNHFPMIVAYESPCVHIEGLRVDARVEDPDGALGQARSAAVYLFRSPDSTVRHLNVVNSPGDGICFGKTSERTVVEDCETAHNGYYGIHPGSHSAFSAVRRCSIHDNYSDGLYVCWGIHHSEFTDNHIYRNGWGMLRSGISIGHKDGDSLIARNRIHENAKYGICFREKTEANGPHRCTVRGNTIENNGSADDELAEVKAKLPADEAIGCGIHVCKVNYGLAVEGNTIRETRPPQEARQRIGIWLTPGVSDFRIAEDNIIDGHPDGDVRDDTETQNGNTG